MRNVNIPRTRDLVRCSVGNIGLGLRLAGILFRMLIDYRAEAVWLCSPHDVQLRTNGVQE